MTAMMIIKAEERRQVLRAYMEGKYYARNTSYI